MSAAERCRAPVILSLAESHFDYFDFDLLMPAVETAARRASVPVAIHLDHGANTESAVYAINLGCNGVMVDASHEPIDENLRRTATVVVMAHACGVPVEGELGYVPGVEGEDAERHPGEITYTTVEEARRFVNETDVDFLAVSIGTVHGRMRGEPKLDFEHLIIYNVKGLNEQRVQAMMAEGRRMLAAIPGVREVITGEAVKAGAAYPYTWLVRFCHPAVIDSYRDHPSHVAFADQLFRPVAGERISIDYQAIESIPIGS